MWADGPVSITHWTVHSSWHNLHSLTSTSFLSLLVMLHPSPTLHWTSLIARLGNRTALQLLKVHLTLMQGPASSQLSGYYEPSIFDGEIIDPWMGHPLPLDTALFRNSTINPSLISGSGPANNILLGLLPYFSLLSSSESSPEPPPPRKLPVTCKDAVFPPPHSALSPSLPSDQLYTLCPYLQPACIPNNMVLSGSSIVGLRGWD